MHRFAVFLFWSAAAIAVFATSINPIALPGNPSDKLQHVAGFSVLTLLAAFAYPRASLLFILLGMSLFGALIEMVQMIPALNRSAEWLDLAADILAAAVILGILAIARRMRDREPDLRASDDLASSTPGC